MTSLLRQRGVPAKGRFLLLNVWVCLVVPEWLGHHQPRCLKAAESVSNKTNASLVFVTLH